MPSTEQPVPPTVVASGQKPTPFLNNLTAALELIRAEPDTAEKETKLENLANKVALADLSTALEFLQAHEPLEISQSLSLRLIRRWAESDPQAAAGWVQQFTDSNRQEALNAVAIVWANQELAAAIEWVWQLPKDEERYGGLITVAYEAARTKPMEALDLAIELPANQARDELVVHAANQWAAKAPELAAEWAVGITDAILRERVLAGIAAAWGESNPVAAAALAIRLLTPGRRQNDALVGIVQRWAQKEPERAVAWVAMFPDGMLREAALENLAKL